MPLVHPKDRYSNISQSPSPDEIARLAQWSRKLHPEATSKGKQSAPHRRIRRRLSPQVIDELIARYKAGEETPALSREFSISASGLRDLLRAEGVSLRGHTITPEDVKKAVQLYESGMTITQVVKHIGYSRDTIRKVLVKHGVVLRSGGLSKRDAKWHKREVFPLQRQHSKVAD
jgi:AraC-like DNA-binding protein